MIGEAIGNFRVVRQLGRGGMGEVWLAEHKDLTTRVAIKVLQAQVSRDTQHVQRFFNEAIAVGKDEAWVESAQTSFRAIRGMPLAIDRPDQLPTVSAAYREPLCARGRAPRTLARRSATSAFAARATNRLRSSGRRTVPAGPAVDRQLDL
jgi:hypothetical protein